MLVGGPHHQKVIDQDAPLPGITIVMHRIPDDGPMVRDLYQQIPDSTAGGLYLAAYRRTEAIPEADTVTGKHVEPLAADLTPFLDWPLLFPQDPLCCNKGDHECADWSAGLPKGFITAGWRRMTVREFLADIKAHAEQAGR
jgi:hypothetical protein